LGLATWIRFTLTTGTVDFINNQVESPGDRHDQLRAVVPTQIAIFTNTGPLYTPTM